MKNACDCGNPICLANIVGRRWSEMPESDQRQVNEGIDAIADICEAYGIRLEVTFLATEARDGEVHP